MLPGYEQYMVGNVNDRSVLTFKVYRAIINSRLPNRFKLVATLCNLEFYDLNTYMYWKLAYYLRIKLSFTLKGSC